jgi:L-alanine-DL-glutamate epimerase-like enolase superfamily enzyme
MTLGSSTSPPPLVGGLFPPDDTGETSKMSGLTITSASLQHERVPITHYVKTAFGVMKERHAVLLLLEDDAGHVGVGETWVNFPTWAPWERIAAFEHGYMPYLRGRHVDDIPAFMQGMYGDFVGAACQSGTISPLIQALCACELALWDLAAQGSGVSLAQHLFKKPHEEVRVYASGINTPLPWDLIDRHLDLGVTLFKLKLGFGEEEDRRNIEALSDHLGTRASLAVDVNRGWTLEQAQTWLPVLVDHNVQWIEEPLRADEEKHLGRLSEACDIPIAGGENVLMPPDTDPQDIMKIPFDILQPDLTKNAPLHVAKRLMEAAGASATRIIPHFLGSAPGQAASLQFAAGCPEGLVELDINRNTLRTDLFTQPFEINNGSIKIPDAPGIGWVLST